ncbi:DUF1097 domain-containing protein [Methyloraptor flagellatus]|uniref:DUF1097 domain-containing protein n=1 Tax=Methyloraptor flagellatus TaxID=3162530 RepID=A0AAU7XDJ7_9HYPH
MNLVTALAIVIGALGAIATYLVLGPAAGLQLQIWIVFIAWASYFHCGGNEAAAKSSFVANVWGAVCATVALILIGKLGGQGLIVISIIVGVTVAIMILGAHVPLLSAIPAAVYGYAATAGYALLSKADAMNFAPGGVLTTVVLSCLVGVIFGWLSGKIAGAIAK